MESILVTGGAGFIGSAFVLLARKLNLKVINLDKLTYSGNLENLISLENDKDHIFIQGDIGDADLLERILQEHRPDAIINFAAESHVDRSIHNPEAFVITNVLGTCVLLRSAKKWWEEQDLEKQQTFRFLHVSTDEVFGTLSLTDQAFTEKTAYAPNSPYSASKAAGDHFVRAYNETYGFPTIITNCSNNYGPRQFPEKLIPLMILNALAGKKLPVYGDGSNIRDWLHVEDHCEAIMLALTKGKIGSTYVIGGNSEKNNLDIVKTICSVLDEICPLEKNNYAMQIEFVKDRPGHDFRYAIDFTKIKTELGFSPKHDFTSGLKNTILWYLENKTWVLNIQNGEYRKWIEKNYSDRG